MNTICHRLQFLAFFGLLVIAGCTERAQQKGIFGLGDPALATHQDIVELRKLINDRFDRLEKKNSPLVDK